MMMFNVLILIYLMESMSHNTAHNTLPASSAAASGAAFSGEHGTPATNAASVDILDFSWDDGVDIMAEYGDIIHDILEAPPSDFPQRPPPILASVPVGDLSETACRQVTSATGDHFSRRIGGDEGQRPDQLKKKMLKPKKTNTKKPREPNMTHLSQADVLDDGYRWSKYGQKDQRHSPYPRSYYRCTSAGCSAKKILERCCHNPFIIVTRYVGAHIHGYTAPFGHSTAEFYPGTSSAGGFSSGGSSTGTGASFGIANAIGGGGILRISHGGAIATSPGTSFAYNVGQYQQGQPLYTPYNNISLALPPYNYGVADDATTSSAAIGSGLQARCPELLSEFRYKHF